MPKTSVADWSTTASSNTDINSIAIGPGAMAVNNTDNVVRELMAQLRTFFNNPTLTDIVMVGSITEDIHTITDGAAFEIDPGNGTIQKITLTASRTPKFTNFANGESILLLVDDGTSYTLTWTDATAGGSGVKWKDAASAPSLDATAMTGIILWKFGGQVYGVNAGTFA